MDEAFYQVSAESFREYVRESKLTETDNYGMHRFWHNAEGRIMARIMHGFTHDVYEIREPNEATLAIVRNLLNHGI